jgi:cell division protein FtsQ
MPDELAEEQRVRDQERRTRRRFQRRQWARRWVSWRYLVALLLIVALLGTGVWLVFFSTQMSVRTVSVRGNELLSAAQVREAARAPLGEQLATADLRRVRSRIAAMAEIESVDVTREWPDTIGITVVERTAVAVVQMGERWRGLDASGAVFRDYDAPPGDLPRVQASSAAGIDALSEAATVVSSMSADLAGRVDHVEVETIDQITLVLRSGRTVLWGSSEDSKLKSRVLLELLDAHPASYYDVSVPGSPTAR